MTDTLERVGARQADPSPPSPMTTGHDAGMASTAEQRPRVARFARASLVPLLLFVAAIVLRFYHLNPAYNIFIDEATYADITRSVAQGDNVTLYGEPFTLHPPLGFYILGAITRLFGWQDLATAPLLLHLRYPAAVFGALVVVGVYLLVRRTGRKKVALAAGAIVCLDPFQNSFDSRVMLESMAQLFAVCTFLTAAAHVARSSPARRWWAAPLLIGLFGALTFATKETFGLVVAAALLLMVILPKAMPRRDAALALASTLTGYALVNVGVILRVGLGEWWTSKSSGLARLLGTHQITGFNAPEAKTSLLDAVVANLTNFGPSYLVMAAGGVAGLLLVVPLLWQQLRGRLRGRTSDAVHLANVGAASRETRVSVVIAAWTVGACAYVCYAIVFGSLEEQMFYIALAPCAAAMSVAAEFVRRNARWVSRVAVAGLCLVLLGQAAIWGYIRSTHDDVYQQFLTWLPAHVPADSTIAVTEDTAQFLITGQNLGEWHTMDQLKENKVDYVLVVPSLADQGYGVATPEFCAEVAENGTLVYSRAGRSEGSFQPLQLFDVRGYTGGSR